MKDFIKEYAVVSFVAITLPGTLTDWYWWALMFTYCFLQVMHDDI